MSAPQPAPQYRRPAEPPNASALSNIEEWDALVASSLERATATAEKWRTGMAALVTVVTSVLLLKGPDAQKIPWPVNLFVIVPLVVGMSLMLSGLWLALAASAPALKTHTDYNSVVNEYRTIGNYKLNAAEKVTADLNGAKRLVICALVAFTVGIIAWWIVPIQVEAPSKISITDRNGVVTCGTVVESTSGTITIRPNGVDTSRVVPLKDVNAVRIGDTCGASGD